MGKHTIKGAGGKRSKTKPQRYGEKTKTWSIGARIPESKKEEMDNYGIEIIKPIIEEKLKTWEVPRETE